MLLLDDDPGVRRSLHLMLRAHGFDVRSHESSMMLLDDPALNEAAFLVADFRVPFVDGVEVLRAMRDRGWRGRAVLVTGYTTAALREAASAAEFAAVLEKPVRPHDLLNALQESS